MLVGAIFNGLKRPPIWARGAKSRPQGMISMSERKHPEFVDTDILV